MNTLSGKPMSQIVLETVFTYEGSDKMAAPDKSLPDKRVSHHDYGAVYDRIFAGLRGRKSVCVEIGVYQGASVRATHRLLPDAVVYGIDVNKPQPIDGVNLIAGDGYAESTWAQIPEGADLIIDDGTHYLTDMVRGIPVFLRHLRNGGTLVIEDVIPAIVSDVLAALPGAVFYDTPKTSRFNDDGLVVYRA